jgi:ribose transport system permease protein
VLGGASLAGGRGSIFGTVLGLLIVGVLNNGLILMDVPSFWQRIAQGLMLIIAVSFDSIRAKLNNTRA